MPPPTGRLLRQDVLGPPSHYDLPFKVEMIERRTLYLVKDAREVRLCDLEGRVMFSGDEGALERSDLASAFPAQL